jgi:hypothetical protein
MDLYSVCESIHNSPIGTSLRESLWAFPIIEGIHVLGLSLSVGLLMWFDLRLLGLVMKDRSISEVHRHFLPFSIAGFAIMFVSGAFLFCANALGAYNSWFFRLKFLFLLLAGVNAAAFELMTKRDITAWDAAPVPPVKVRLAGALSLVLWAVIITFGRATAYTLL